MHLVDAYIFSHVETIMSSFFNAYAVYALKKEGIFCFKMPSFFIANYSPDPKGMKPATP